MTNPNKVLKGLDLFDKELPDHIQYKLDVERFPGTNERYSFFKSDETQLDRWKFDQQSQKAEIEFR